MFHLASAILCLAATVQVFMGEDHLPALAVGALFAIAGELHLLRTRR